MTRDDIIKMAKEAKLPYEYDTGRVIHLKELERFAALIEKHPSYDGIHTCNEQCQRPACVAIREAVAREREACAKIVETNAKVCEGDSLLHKVMLSNAEAIRARAEL